MDVTSSSNVIAQTLSLELVVKSTIALLELRNAREGVSGHPRQVIHLIRAMDVICAESRKSGFTLPMLTWHSKFNCLILK